MNKYLIVGLGNVGNEYTNTRHNIGFDVVGAFVYKHGGFFSNNRLANVASVKIKGRTFVCILPTTFMNLSGKAFKYWMDKENIALENTLTVLDDLALPLNKIRLRGNGSHAGHNGLRDIENTIGTNAYARLRFGIGNNFPKGMQAEFVLGKWEQKEIPIVQKKVQNCIEVIENFAFLGLEKTMNAANTLVIE